MKVIDKFKGGKTLFTFELLPPLKGESIESLNSTIERLKPYGPSYVNITYHQSEVEYRKEEDGSSKRYIVRKRPGTVALAAALSFKHNIDMVPHLICGGFTKESTEDALIELNFLGISNILALRGDTRKGETGPFRPEIGGNAHAIDLVRQIKDMNAGKYLDSSLKQSTPSDFCIGVAGYPECHLEARTLEEDIIRLKEKIDAGGEYVVTQMFFNNEKYFDFLELCAIHGINVPIVPGLKPLSTIRQLELLPKVFGIEFPKEFVDSLTRYQDDPVAVRQIGTEWCIRQSKQLYAANVPALHYYTMGKPDNVEMVAGEIFSRS